MTLFRIQYAGEDGEPDLVSAHDSLDEAELALTALEHRDVANLYWIGYDFEDHTKLADREIVRVRPGMFIGDTSQQGCHHLLMEVVSNSVDQFLQGHATRIAVQAQGQTFEVSDDGAGFSMEKARDHLTRLHFTPTADRHAPHIHLAPSGVGISVVNFLSAEMTVESLDDQGGWRLSFRRGRLVSEERIPNPSGTLVRATLDPRIFGQTGIPLPVVRRVLFDAAHLFPGLPISLNRETFFSADGLLDLTAFEALDIHRGLRFGTVFDGPELSLSCACTGKDVGAGPTVRSWVNGVLTPEHGSHVEGLLAALAWVGWRPAALMIHVVMKEPRYAGPTRDKLALPKVRTLVRDALIEPLRSFVSRHSRQFETSGE